jgi:hypothetical protein
MRPTSAVNSLKRVLLSSSFFNTLAAKCGMVHREVAEPRPSGSGIHYESARKPLPHGRGSATQYATELNLAQNA